MNEHLRGVLAETATTGLVRYEWRLLCPLLHAVLNELLADFAPPALEDEVRWILATGVVDSRMA